MRKKKTVDRVLLHSSTHTFEVAKPNNDIGGHGSSLRPDNVRELFINSYFIKIERTRVYFRSNYYLL